MKQKGSFSIANFNQLIVFIVILVFFSFLSNGRLVSAVSLFRLVDQSIVNVILGCGVLFIVAMGSVDLSIGVGMALSGVIGLWAALELGNAWLLLPFAIIIGTCFGFFNGFIISRFKVPSLIHTIAMLIGMRGIVNLIQINPNIYAQFIPAAMRGILNSIYIKMTVFVLIVIVMWYLFEYTRVGWYAQAIGENELVARFVGVPVDRMKILAYTLSGMMTGIAAIYSIVTLGGTSHSMGVGNEMRTVMAVFLGGVLTTGGKSARTYKVLLGVFSITTLLNGLSISGYPEMQIQQLVGGLILLASLVITTRISIWSRTRRNKLVEAELSDDLKETAVEMAEKLAASSAEDTIEE